MQYLFITNQFMIGGVERVFLNIASNINNVKILLLPIHSVYDENLIKQLPKNVTLIKNDKIKIKGMKTAINLFRLAHFANTELVQDSNDLCCVNFSDTISTIIVSCLIKAKKHLTWCHCNPNAFRASKFFFFYRLFFNKFENIVCLCDSQKNEFCKVFGKKYGRKALICYNQTDLNVVDSLKDDELNFNKKFILMVARFDNRSKDFYTLIDAYKNLSPELKQEYSLVLVGNGDDFDKIKNYAELSGESERIYFAGMQSNPYKWMSRAKLFVLSSKTEGFPLVVCEALSCGCPVISSDCIAGPKDILENGRYGLLFPVGDSKTLTDEMALLLTDNEKYSTFKSTARQRVVDINQYAITSLQQIFCDEENT